jgi:hypothetical protein
MEKYKIFATIAFIFVSSLIAIIVGYYNSIDWFSVQAIVDVFQGIHIVRSSLILTALPFVFVAAAFLLSKGNYVRYIQYIIGNSLIYPYFVIMLILPGAKERPQNLGDHYIAMCFISVLSQYLASKYIAKTLWIAGGRDIDESKLRQRMARGF